MSVAVLVITDGRDAYLEQAVDSVVNLSGNITEWWMFDDTGDESYRASLAARYPAWRHINGGPRLGASGAVRKAWEILNDQSSATYIFHLEQDFVITRVVPLDDLAGLLYDYPHIAQVVLRRNPVNPLEQAAGGVVEQHPGWYVDRIDPFGRRWLEHSAYWSNNPCLYRTSILDLGWPEHIAGQYGESTFTFLLREHGMVDADGDQVRFAYWGPRDTGVWVEHIGHERSPEASKY
jgi:hypothetical protein